MENEPLNSLIFVFQNDGYMKQIFLLFALLSISLGSQARELLTDLDFTSGKWEMVGVSLTNYREMPIQEELGTFIVRERHVLEKFQNEWDFEEKFDDYCDYHYALKFYKNGELQKTMLVNLLCNYITANGLSFEFSDADLIKYKRYFRTVRWSRIRFSDLDLLQKSVDVLDAVPTVYWYSDYQQYNFSGEFSVTVNNLPWDANRDSVINVVSTDLSKKMGREDFYITTKYWLLSDDFEKMTLRLNVFCDESFYESYTDNNVITTWRNHFTEQSFIQIMVIGMSRKEYYSYMRGRT